MWLLEKSVRDALSVAMRSGFKPDADREADFSARIFQSQADGGSRVLSVAGHQAQINISGVLTTSPNFFAMLFGGGNTTYGEINAAIAAAEADPSVKEITYRMDTPGGSIDGMFGTIEAMQRVKKPTKVLAVNKIASAGYALASQADKIEAENAATMFGSIGVVTERFIDENIVSITSTNAPNKRPDPSTKEGQAVIREELDAIERVMMEAIATGRGTTVEKIIADYGQGGMLLAGEALTRGMIDSVAKPALAVVPAVKPTTASGGSNRSTKAMDLNELKAQHPEVFAAAVKLGADKERDRVVAHLTMGEASGDLKTATAAVKDGSEMTATLMATYSAAVMNRAAKDSRASDDDAAAAALKKKADEGSKGEQSNADKVAALVCAQLGYDPKEA